MEGSNKKANMQIPPLPPLPPSHPGRQSSNNSSNIPPPPSSHEISGNPADKAKELASPLESTLEPNSETLVVDLEDDEPEGPNIEFKKQKRILASRQYSRRYRIKQFYYVEKLEKEAKALEAEIAVKAPRVKYADRHNMLLRAENNAIRQRISACNSELMIKKAQHEVLSKERDSLLQLFQVQQQLAQAPVNPPGLGYQMANLGLNYQPAGLGLGIADQFNGTTGQVDTQLLNQISVNQFAVGQSFVEMNNMGMTNNLDLNNINLDYFDMNVNDMDMNPLDMISDDDDDEDQNPAGSSSNNFI